MKETSSNVMDTALKAYDYINPDHYKQGKDVWEMMVAIWGQRCVYKAL